MTLKPLKGAWETPGGHLIYIDILIIRDYEATSWDLPDPFLWLGGHTDCLNHPMDVAKSFPISHHPYKPSFIAI